MKLTIYHINMEELIKKNFDLMREAENLALRIKEIKGNLAINDLALKGYLEENGLIEEEFSEYVLRLRIPKIASVEILDEVNIPSELMTYKESVQPNKTAIKEYLKTNQDCSFAQMVFSEPKVEYKRI